MLQHVRGALRRSFSSSASPVHFETLDVFATSRFGGNPLAVVFDEQQRLSDSEMQQVAAEFNYSETTFVLPPRDPERNTAWVRIFSPKEEFPFAGHPNVGTATVLARRGEIFGRPPPIIDPRPADKSIPEAKLLQEQAPADHPLIFPKHSCACSSRRLPHHHLRDH